jgi:rhodanese-related sulfurtransferase
MKQTTLRTSPCGNYIPRPMSAKGIRMKLIAREELKQALDQKSVKLIFVQGDWQYRTMHIPGSINLHSEEEALRALKPSDNIVVYCVNDICPISVSAYNFLVDHGFKNVRRYAGGLTDWNQAGYPLEGEITILH